MLAGQRKRRPNAWSKRVQPPPTSQGYMTAKRSGEAKMSDFIMRGRWEGYTPPPLPDR